MKKDLYSEVSQRIADQLAAGTVPWVKPWSATAGRNVAHNAVTGRRYSGVNVIMLWLAMNRGWNVPAFLTFNQAKAAGGSVKKGEHGTKVYFVKKLDVQDKRKLDPEARRQIMMLREFTVFNIEQCEGLPERITNPAAKAPRNPDIRDATIDDFVAASGIEVRNGGDRAFYTPTHDFVSMPAFEAFRGAAPYYATMFHELGHATGHKSRLDRDFAGRFGDAAYAAEELVAELTAAFLCAEFDLDGDLRHADYIANWIRLLKDDSKAFFTACSKAEAAAGYLRDKALAEEPDDIAEAA